MMETTEPRPVPLAYDLSGDPFDPPVGAEFWKVRRMHRGLMNIGPDGSQKPLYIKLSSTMDEAIAVLVELNQPYGRYRLDPVDAVGQACGAKFTIITYRPLVGAEGADVEPGAPAPAAHEGGDAHSRVIVDQLLAALNQSVAANAGTSARIGEALAANAQHSGQAQLAAIGEVFARLMSMAHDTATTRQLALQPPEAAAPAPPGGDGLAGMLGPMLGQQLGQKGGAIIDALLDLLRGRRAVDAPPPPPPPRWYPQPRNGVLDLSPLPWPPPAPFRLATAPATPGYAADSTEAAELGRPGAPAPASAPAGEGGA